MIANNPVVTGIIVFLIGYLLGSIPAAYIFTRMTTGEDIRKLGGGNVGGLNTFREVGALPAIGVGIIDFGKGAAVVGITHSLMQVDSLYVFLAAAAAVVGHNWMVWLKFDGGKGMGATIGALAVLMPVFGYLTGLWILLGIIVVLLLATRNVAMAMGIGLLSLPFIAWLGGDGSISSGLFATWSVIVGLMIAAKFAPTAIAALRQTTGVKDFIRGH